MELIDSKYTREKYKELGIEFTDWQKATIIWNKPMNHQECINALKELAEKTFDVELQKQIRERVKYEEKQLTYIMENPNNDYVYIVRNAKDNCDYGVFYKFDTALVHARKYAKEDEEKMCIYKIQIVKGEGIPTRTTYSRWNPNLFPEKKEIEEYEREYSDGVVGRVTISTDGEICVWWSVETTMEEDMVVDTFDVNRFETKFIKLPYVHEAGMIVKYTLSGEIGVLATGKEDWDEFLDRVDKGLYVDYFDKSHEVFFLKEKGYWSHDHLCPLLLEKVGLTTEVAVEKGEEFCRALKALSEYFAGNQSVIQEQMVIRTVEAYMNRKRGNNVEMIEDILW